MKNNKMIAISVLMGILILLIGLGGWFLWNLPNSDKGVLNFGKGIVVGEKGSHIQVLSIEDPTLVLAEWQLPVYEILPDHQSQSLIVLTDESPKRVFRLTYSGETPELKQIYDVNYEFTDETEVRWIEDTGFFFEPSTQTFTMINPEQLTETTYTLNVKQLEDWTATNTHLFYAHDQKISVYDIANEKVLTTISLESPTSALFIKGEQLHVVSQFGEESGFTTTLTLATPSLAIEKLSSLKDTELSFFNGMMNEELVYYQTTKGKDHHVSYESYNIVKHESDQTLTLTLEEEERVWFEQQFAYILSPTNGGRVQSIYSIKPLWSHSQSIDWLFPIW